MVEPDTIRLLRECDAGIKMGVSAIEDVVDRVADKRFRRTLDLALCVGILDSEIEYAARLMREPLVDHRAVNPAEMDKARGARREARHLGALRQIPFRIAFFDILRRQHDVGKQQTR